MTTGMSDQELFDFARRKIETGSFYTHFGLYSALNALLVLVWRFTGKGFPWFAFPLGIWGIIIVLHLMTVSVLYDRRKPSERARKHIEQEVLLLKEKARREEERRKGQKK